MANPSMYFCLVASPSLNPLFSRVIDGLCTARRVLKNSSISDILKTRYHHPVAPQFDGPVTFLKQANRLSGFEGSVDQLFQYGIDNPEKWLHALRNHWRSEQFRRVAVNRPDFDGVQNGVDRESTILHLR